MVFLDKLWDDVVAGPQPDKGLKHLRSPKSVTDISVPSDVASPGSLASTPPASPSLASPSFSREKENVWRSVFHPGSNRQVMRRLGSNKFDNVQPDSPSVYDWLYSKDTKTEWR
ncbi:unnamed protein product [Sphagnum troendelagicum]|uniref:Uncharacterized protein n=1 Tax=Sphagnum troendelagicum TaxID=128251 RepID=A0ABP0TU09_9BRYO